MTTGTARDLSAKLQARLAEVLERELTLFTHVLNPAEIGEVMIEAAIMVGRSTASTIAGYASDRKEVRKLYREVSKAIVFGLGSREDEAIAQVLEKVAAEQRRAT